MTLFAKTFMKAVLSRISKLMIEYDSFRLTKRMSFVIYVFLKTATHLRL